jgi:type I restriction enzyme M protein
MARHNPGERNYYVESVHFLPLSYDELFAGDKTNLDIFWLKDDSLEDTENLPPPDVLVSTIVENLGAALEQFSGIQEELEVEEGVEA